MKKKKINLFCVVFLTTSCQLAAIMLNAKVYTTDIVDAISEHQKVLRAAAYQRYKEYILSYVTNESLMKYTKQVVLHLDASQDYMNDALNDVLRDLESVFKFQTLSQRVVCGPHDLQRLTLKAMI